MARDNSQNIAAIYAEALFEVAQQRHQSELVHAQLVGLAELIQTDAQFAEFLACPAIGRKQKIDSITRVFKDKLSELLMNFLDILNNRDRLALLSRISHEYNKLEDNRAGRIKATAVTAIELDDKEQARLSEQIGRALHKKVLLQTKTDISIIGGLILKIDNTIMDGSVKHSLEKLSEQIRQKAGELLANTQELIIE